MSRAEGIFLFIPLLGVLLALCVIELRTGLIPNAVVIAVLFYNFGGKLPHQCSDESQMEKGRALLLYFPAGSFRQSWQFVQEAV